MHLVILGPDGHRPEAEDQGLVGHLPGGLGDGGEGIDAGGPHCAHQLKHPAGTSKTKIRWMSGCAATTSKCVKFLTVCN